MTDENPEIPQIRQTVEYKDLEGTAANPEGTLLVTVYNKKRNKFRKQVMKRKTLMGKMVLYKSAATGTQQPGRIEAFCLETGMPYIRPLKDEHPVDTTDIFFVVEGV